MLRCIGGPLRWLECLKRREDRQERHEKTHADDNRQLHLHTHIYTDTPRTISFPDYKHQNPSVRAGVLLTFGVKLVCCEVEKWEVRSEAVPERTAARPTAVDSSVSSQQIYIIGCSVDWPVDVSVCAM